MSKRKDNRARRISELAGRLPGPVVADVEPRGDESVPASEERIRALAAKKRERYNNGKGEAPVKKLSIKIMLLVAAICLMSVTAFAALGGLDYFRSIFGDSAGSIAGEIHTPAVKTQADGREMALEAVVTDGYVTNLVISITGQPVKADVELFAVTGDFDMQSVAWFPMEEFSTSSKTFFNLELVSEKRFSDADITVALNPAVAAAELRFRAENNLGNCVVEIPADAFPEANYAIRELAISPMGFLAIAHESQAKGGLPSLLVELVFEDGKTESLEVEFDDGEGTVGGGGGVIMGGPGQEMPLVTSFSGRRNPDGEVVTHGQFSRIIDPERIVKVRIQDKEFPVR